MHILFSRRHTTPQRVAGRREGGTSNGNDNNVQGDHQSSADEIVEPQNLEDLLELRGATGKQVLGNCSGVCAGPRFRPQGLNLNDGTQVVCIFKDIIRQIQNLANEVKWCVGFSFLNTHSAKLICAGHIHDLSS